MLVYYAIAKRWLRNTVAGLMSLVMASVFVACASETPKGSPTPTVDQVRGHADRTFEKLKQEEQERAAQPSVAR